MSADLLLSGCRMFCIILSFEKKKKKKTPQKSMSGEDMPWAGRMFPRTCLPSNRNQVLLSFLYFPSVKPIFHEGNGYLAK